MHQVLNDIFLLKKNNFPLYFSFQMLFPAKKCVTKFLKLLEVKQTVEDSTTADGKYNISFSKMYGKMK